MFYVYYRLLTNFIPTEYNCNLCAEEEDTDLKIDLLVDWVSLD